MKTLLSTTVMYNLIYKLLRKGITPAWIVLAWDTFISSFCLVFTIFFFESVMLNRYNSFNSIMEVFLINTVVALLLNYIAGSHKVVVRFQKAGDLLVLYSAHFLITGMTLLACTFFAKQGLLKISYSMHSFALSYLATIFFVTISRLVIRYLYDVLVAIKAQKSVKKLIIYGAGELGISIKRGFDSLHRSNYSIVAFLDDDKKYEVDEIEEVDIQNKNEVSDSRTHFKRENGYQKFVANFVRTKNFTIKKQ